MLELGSRTLVKFLEAMNDGGIGGGIRCKPVLLQIRSIVPVCKTDDQIWPDQGFFLKVADVSHALYVSLPREDDDMVFSNKLQLGQLVYIDKLEAAFPVPRVRGITPIPGRRPVAGNPKDLLSAVGMEMFLDDQSLNALKEDGQLYSRIAKGDIIKSSSFRSSTVTSCSQVESEDLGAGAPVMNKSASFSSSNGKIIDGMTRAQNFLYTKRQQKLDLLENGGDSDTESMVSSCSASSTVKRKSWSIRKRCSIVPDSSPSPERKVSMKSSASPVRLSLLGDDKSMVIGKKSVISVSKKFTKPLSKESSSKSGSVLSNKLEDVSTKSALSSCSSSRKNLESDDIAWVVLSPRLKKYGEEVFKKRDLAFLAAIDGLLEAAAFQRLLRCLRSFSQLLSEKPDDQHCTVEKFFNLQDDLLESRVIGESLTTDNEGLSERKSNAVSWINLALESDLSSIPPSQESPACCRWESPVESNGPPGWLKGCAFPEYAELANSLETESSLWFLKHVESYLNWVISEMNPEKADGHIAKMMYQIKRISDWLDKRCKETSTMNDVELQICGILRKKIYNILLKHVEMTTIRRHTD